MLERSFSLNNLKSMEIIDVSIGARIGYINDFKIDLNESVITSILIGYSKSFWFSKSSYLEVPWDKIIKIGVDVILIDGGKVDLLNLSN